jgi:hypothetical protein
VPNIVPPKGASYQVMLAPAGKVPIMVAVKTAVFPLHTATSVPIISKLGKLFITVPRIRLEQVTTQANAGGLTEIYLDLGTYVKSFYSVMYAPSCVKIAEMGVSNKRLHHMVKWKYAVPQIVAGAYKKA